MGGNIVQEVLYLNECMGNCDRTAYIYRVDIYWFKCSTLWGYEKPLTILYANSTGNIIYDFYDS